MVEFEANNSGEIIPVNFSGPQRGPVTRPELSLNDPLLNSDAITGRERLALGEARYERDLRQAQVAREAGPQPPILHENYRRFLAHVFGNPQVNKPGNKDR